VILVTGSAASGKTSFLRAIAAAKEAAGSYGPPVDETRLLRHGTGSGRLESTWFTDDAGVSHDCVFNVGEAERPRAPLPLRTLFSELSYSRDRGKFEYFAASRRLHVSRSSPLLPPSTPVIEAGYRLTEHAEKYSLLYRVLSDLTTNDASATASLLSTRGVALRSDLPDSLGLYKAAVGRACPWLRMVAVEPQERRRPLIWFEKQGASFRLELDELSESEQQSVLFACTFARLGLHHSVVLIDTPELGVHPSDHLRFFQAICHLGEDNQIIAATTSPAILASVGQDQVIHLTQHAESRR
jgi:energy-coupling factor transporter ATP-binding protein EcfA2